MKHRNAKSYQISDKWNVCDQYTYIFYLLIIVHYICLTQLDIQQIQNKFGNSQFRKPEKKVGSSIASWEGGDAKHYV